MTIPLGFESRTGKPVNIPLRHTAVIGRTQHGKTITLEALIDRAGLRALAFVTKRGEQGFTRGRMIPPFFQEPGETGEPMWMFISSLLETAVGEKLKKQRACIMRVSKASAVKNMVWDKPTTLLDVATNVKAALEHTRSGFFQDMYLELDEYFQIIMPQIGRLPKSSRLDLQPGINIMFLENLSDEMQALCIASCCKWCRTREKKTITILPEAWKFTGKSTPALGALRQLAREGSVLENYVWLDSQDLVGIDAEIRKQIGVWILGVQGESIEAERTIKQLPSELRRIKLADIQQLRKGYFFVSWGEGTREVYVQPSWMTADEACAVAYTRSAPLAAPAKAKNSEDEMFREQAEKAQQRVAELQQMYKELEAELVRERDDNNGLRQLSKRLTQTIDELRAKSPQPFETLEQPSGLRVGTNALEASAMGMELVGAAVPTEMDAAEFWLARIWPLVSSRVAEEVAKEPTILQVLVNQSEIRINVKPRIVTLTDETIDGRLAILISKGVFDQGAKHIEILKHFGTRGDKPDNRTLSLRLMEFVRMGLLIKNGNNQFTTYTKMPGVKITKTEIESAN